MKQLILGVMLLWSTQVWAQTYSIDSLHWLAGHWSGAAFGGQCEEVWTSSNGSSMMGMFQLVKADGVSFYEFMTISETEGQLQLTLRHFNRDLTGWEDKTAPLVFSLDHLEDRKAVFGKLTYERLNENHLQITLMEKDKAGNPRVFVFDYYNN